MEQILLKLHKFCTFVFRANFVFSGTAASHFVLYLANWACLPDGLYILPVFFFT